MSARDKAAAISLPLFWGRFPASKPSGVAPADDVVELFEERTAGCHDQEARIHHEKIGGLDLEGAFFVQVGSVTGAALTETPAPMLGIFSSPAPHKMGALAENSLRMNRRGAGPAARRPGSRRQEAMKATGIVRRIDDLGRVVIPKEIRRTMKIREGDPPLMTLTPLEGYILGMLELDGRMKGRGRYSPK